jgi:hypothetical protein
VNIPHKKINFNLTGSCLIPVFLIWIGPMVYFTRTGQDHSLDPPEPMNQLPLNGKTEGENFLPDYGENLLMATLPTWVTGSHICQAVPWRNSLRADSSQDHLAQHFYVPKLSSISKTLCERYSLCARNNVRYLLVFVCTFSEWIKAFSTETEKAWKVARYLLKEITPRSEIPVPIGSDNGLAFLAGVVQLMAKRLKIT